MDERKGEREEGWKMSSHSTADMELIYLTQRNVTCCRYARNKNILYVIKQCVHPVFQ